MKFEIGTYIGQFIFTFLFLCLAGFIFKFLEMYVEKAFVLALGVTIFTLIVDYIKFVTKKRRTQ